MIDLAKATKNMPDNELRDYINSATIKFFERGIMVIKKIHESTLNAALGQYIHNGFSLREDVHFLELWHNGKRVAAYNASKVTIAIIREGCANYLQNTTEDMI